MTTFPTMKASVREEEMIPQLAVEAFRHAFTHAVETFCVVYAKDQKLVEQGPNGETRIIKDISSDYITIHTSNSTFKRKNKAPL